MKSLKTKRNALIIAGSIIIAGIQLAIILYRGMDVINIVSFTVLQYLYMDLVKASFDIKMEEVAAENNGK
jgi:hypothetical protein